MLLENISLGKTLEIFVDREGYRYRLVSKVEDTNAKRVCVSVIAANGRAFKFRPEDEVRLVYKDEEQMWEWLNVKAGLAKLEGEPVHYFEIVNKGQSFNRRNAYRVNIDEELMIGYYEIPNSREKSSLIPLIKEEYEVVSVKEKLSEEKAELNIKEMDTTQVGTNTKNVLVETRVRHIPLPDAEPKMVRALIKNISETGLGVYCNCEFKEKDSFFAEIPSPYGPLKVKAVVVRVSDRISSRERYHYYYGCVYSESDKKMIRYIYEIQRKLIQKQREQREMQSSMRKMNSVVKDNNEKKE